LNLSNNKSHEFESVSFRLIMFLVIQKKNRLVNRTSAYKELINNEFYYDL
jgi:hypothetical protein